MSTELRDALETMSTRGTRVGAETVADRALDAAPAERMSTRSRVRGRSLLAAAAALVITAAGATAVYVRTRVEHVKRVDLSSVLEHADEAAMRPTSILIVGSDKRDGVEGARADTLIVLRVDPVTRNVTALWIPRDLYLPVPGETRSDRLASPLTEDRSLLIKTIRAAMPVTIDHYVEIDLEGFRRIVDAAGGVKLRVDVPIRDQIAGLALEPGCVELDGATALAYVRSRHLEERQDDGSYRADPTGDLGRIARQQALFFNALRQTRASAAHNPVVLNRVLSAATDSITTDDDLTTKEMLLLLKTAMADGGRSAIVVPTRPAVVDGAAVLELDRDALPTALRAFDTPSSTTPASPAIAADCG